MSVAETRSSVVTQDSSASANGVPTRRLRIPDFAYPIIGVVGILALFEAISRLEIVPSRHFPPVTQMIVALADEVRTTVFWDALGSTLQGWAIGLAIAIGIAVPVGLVIGSSIFVYRAVRPIVEFLRPVPSVALIPLAILIYGRDMETKVFLIVFASIWPILIQAIYGVRDVDPVARDAARAYGLGAISRLVRVTLPSALPYIGTGIRIASAIALVLAITGELVVGAPGLGRQILFAQSGGAVDQMYAYIIATGLLGWALNALISRMERRVLRWHPAYREEGASA